MQKQVRKSMKKSIGSNQKSQSTLVLSVVYLSKNIYLDLNMECDGKDVFYTMVTSKTVKERVRIPNRYNDAIDHVVDNETEIMQNAYLFQVAQSLNVA